MAPSISAVFPIIDGVLVYPEIGCLTDDIADYTINVSCIFCILHFENISALQVDYEYTRCPGNTLESGSMSSSGANGSIFTITGLGSYTRWVVVSWRNCIK